jgi:hypothetical protein
MVWLAGLPPFVTVKVSCSKAPVPGSLKLKPIVWEAVPHWAYTMIFPVTRVLAVKGATSFSGQK